MLPQAYKKLFALQSSRIVTTLITTTCGLICWLGTALFWVITQRTLLIPYRRFGTTHRSYLLGYLILEDGPDMMFRNVGIVLPLLAA